MKAKIVTAIIALSVTSVTPVYAEGIQSAIGISESTWHESSTYKNFQCPSNTVRVEGMDLNYTTNRNDDYFYITCEPITIRIQPTTTFGLPSSDTTTVVTPISSDTQTVTTSSTTEVTPTTTTVNSDTSTVTTNSSSTTTTSLTNSQLITLILELFNKLMALLSQLK